MLGGRSLLLKALRLPSIQAYISPCVLHLSHILMLDPGLLTHKTEEQPYPDINMAIHALSVYNVMLLGGIVPLY